MKQSKGHGGSLARRAFLCVAAAFLCIPAVARAQGQAPPSTFVQQQRQIDLELQRQLDEKRPLSQDFEIEWGGMYSFYLFLYDDGINSSRTFRRNDLRVWGRVGVGSGAHEAYVRGILSYEDWNTGDSFDGDDNDWVGPNLERGYYQFDLQKAAQYYMKESIPYDVRVKVGRDFVEWGTGYAIALPLDQVSVAGEYANFEVMGLIGKTPGSLDNIDTTRTGYDASDRCFYGVKLEYKGFEKHRPFFYWMKQNDNQEEIRWPLFQRFSYDSQYFSIGSTGEIVENLRYSTEWLWENGKSYGDRQFLKQNEIDAYAWDVLIEYLPTWKCKPRFSAEYMFASGDADRFGSPTNAIGGNSRENDSSFVGFGFRDTGLSFAPVLSNINIWRAGASFYPLYDTRGFENLEVGTDWFLYYKNHSTGAVSDPTADLPSSYLGWEMDYFANWRITSDLAVTARLGTFFPGQAFSDQTTRTFFLTGLTWSF